MSGPPNPHLGEPQLQQTATDGARNWQMLAVPVGPPEGPALAIWSAPDDGQPVTLADAERFAARVQPGVDWRVMFAKYTGVVGEAEGVTFLRSYDWTPAEWAAIEALGPDLADASRGRDPQPGPG